MHRASATAVWVRPPVAEPNGISSGGCLCPFPVFRIRRTKQNATKSFLRRLVALLDDTLNPIANLANIAALLYDALDTINWCGFYLMDDGALTLAPFCGLPACTRIPIGRGVCGTAAQTGTIQRVGDVHAFPGHIACDSASAKRDCCANSSEWACRRRSGYRQPRLVPL